MSKTIKFWCDSGANIHSCKRGEITTDELGFSDCEWDEIPEEEKEEIMKEYALDGLDWGWVEENKK